jgi:hypothetical protein
MNTRDSQSGNSNVFDQIKNLQVEAPQDVMSASITRANNVLFKKRLFRWTTFGLGIAFVLGLLIFPWNKDASTVETKMSNNEKETPSKSSQKVMTPTEELGNHSTSEGSSDMRVKEPQKSHKNTSVETSDQVASKSVQDVPPVVEVVSPDKNLNIKSEPEELEEKMEVQPSETNKKVDRSGQKKLKLKIPKP